MGKKLLAATAAISLAGSSLIGAPALASEPTSSKPAAQDHGKKVCKSVIPSGSRLSVRTCRTQAEWDRETDKAQQGIMSYSQDHGGDIHPTRGRPGQ